MRLLAAFLALVATQALPPFAIRWISTASYESHSLSGAAEDCLTIATLLVGASGLAIGGRGIYLTIVRLRPWLAGLLTALVWAPLVLSAAVYGYALLVFRSWA